MTTWTFSFEALLFPAAVVAIWASIFLLMLFITRYAAHEHDSEAQAEAKREEQAQAASAAGSAMPPLPA